MQLEEIKQLKKMELEEKNREIRIMNAQRFQRSKSRGNRKSV